MQLIVCDTGIYAVITDNIVHSIVKRSSYQVHANFISKYTVVVFLLLKNICEAFVQYNAKL